LKKEAETLVKSGYDVKLLVWDRGRTCASQIDCPYQIKKFKLRVLPDSIKVCIYLPLWWLYLTFQLLVEKWDAIHAADFDTFAPALIVAKFRNKPIIYDIFDFYADMIRFPIFPKLFRSFFAKIDRFLIRFADIVILPDDSRKEQIGLSNNEKVVTIINAPLDIVFPEKSVKSPVSENFTIFYGGYISDDRGIDIICQAVGTLSGVRLVIMGPCSDNYGDLLRSISKNTSNIELFLSWTPHEEIIRQTEAADMMFAFYDPNIPNNRYASPNKLFEAMMCNKAILVNDDTSMAQIVKNYNCGLIIPYNDVRACSEAILILKNDVQLRQLMGNNGRMAYDKEYNWGSMERKLISLYKGVFE